MGLDSYMFTADVQKENNIIVSKNEKEQLAYWRKCWFLHEHLTKIYQDTIDSEDIGFNCTTMELNLPMLMGLHQAMCDEAHSQNLSFEEVKHYDRVTSYEIDELKKVIKFIQENPTETVYYMGWY